MRETLSRNQQRLLLLSMPREENIAQEILWRLERAWPHSMLTDAVAWFDLDGTGEDATHRGNLLVADTLANTPAYMGDPVLGRQVLTLVQPQYLQRLILPGDDLQIGDYDWSLMMWGMLTDKSTGKRLVTWFSTGGDLRFSISYVVGPDRFVVTTTTNIITSSIGSPVSGVWYSFAMEHSAGTVTLWATGPDGTTYSDSAASSIPAPVTVPDIFSLGGAGLEGVRWSGQIGPTAVFKRRLSNANRDEFWNGGRGIRWSGRRIRVLRG